jgi:bifunctional DNA-binding transcriptional regulator/antitoxin component of YhaV-PrlF toxin-antitoxin module
VVCTLNGDYTFQCALLPNKEEFCIGINKAVREKLGLVDGSVVKVKLEPDTSKYGAPMPEELREVLNQDPDGDRMFHALTGGKQRSLIYWVRSVKDVDKRIHLALIMLKHLRDNDGKVIGDQLYEESKRPMF